MERDYLMANFRLFDAVQKLQWDGDDLYDLLASGLEKELDRVGLGAHKKRLAIDIVKARKKKADNTHQVCFPLHSYFKQLLILSMARRV